LSRLDPLDEELPSEVRALAQELRTLFESLDTSVRRYASNHAYDPGTVSRFLNGKRPPPWGFVKGLLTEVGEQRGEPPTEEAVTSLRQTYIRLRRAGGASKGEVLEFLLEERDQEVREARARERATAELLRDRQHRLDQVEGDLRALRARRVEDSEQHVLSLASWLQENERLRSQRDSLQQEVDFLKKDLFRARWTAEDAEERCAKLERKLEEAEAESVKGHMRDATAKPPSNVVSEPRAAAQRGERQADTHQGGGGAVSDSAGPSATGWDPATTARKSPWKKTQESTWSPFILLVAVAIAFLSGRGYWMGPTKSLDFATGLDYEAGDEPNERYRSGHIGECADAHDCTYAWSWSLVSEGHIRTTFALDGSGSEQALAGHFFLEPSHRCPEAAVYWSVFTTTGHVVSGTVTAMNAPEYFTGYLSSPMGEALIFTAERTDSRACAATLSWIHPGLVGT
jgi:hypothetical protein